MHCDLGATWVRTQAPASKVRRLAELWRMRMTVSDLRSEVTGSYSPLIALVNTFNTRLSLVMEAH